MAAAASTRNEASVVVTNRYGWRPDLPDHRDFRLAASPLAALPERVDLRLLCPPPFDQGGIGSCTANAIANAHIFAQMKQGGTPLFEPSRLFTYFSAREYENSTESDAGCSIRDGMKSIVRQGVCPEVDWPYLEGRFRLRPPSSAYVNALNHQGITYRRIQQNLTDMRSCLAGGFPFVFGFTVYESFESDAVAASGLLGMPSASEAVVGGHAVLCVGYNNVSRRFLIMNSWGKDWGYHGYFAMPYGYLTDSGLASDFWTLSLVEV